MGDVITPDKFRAAPSSLAAPKAGGSASSPDSPADIYYATETLVQSIRGACDQLYTSVVNDPDFAKALFDNRDWARTARDQLNEALRVCAIEENRSDIEVD